MHYKVCFLIANLFMCLALPFASSASTISTPKEPSLPSECSLISLETVSESSSMSRKSGVASLKTQKINTKFQNWWKRIHEAEQAAYRATNYVDKFRFGAEAKRLRDEFQKELDMLEDPEDIH